MSCDKFKSFLELETCNKCCVILRVAWVSGIVVVNVRPLSHDVPGIVGSSMTATVVT